VGNIGKHPHPGPLPEGEGVRTGQSIVDKEAMIVNPR
jgi:hypothetical protein